MKLVKFKIFKKKIKNLPIKYLSFGLKKKNFYTQSYTKAKKKYRFIDFFRNTANLACFVLRVEYDPNRTASIALICYKNGFLSYIIAPSGLRVNSYITPKILAVGSINSLNNFSYGSFLHCLELIQSYGFKIARSAGTFCILLNKFNKNFFLLKLPSGEERLIYKNNRAVLGIVSNTNIKFNKLKKAGNSR
jgi:large subunit ribosomal protein L2